MTSVRVAIYARVSSDQQVEGGTVASQLAALQARLAQDGARLEPACRFVDEGYSGATLVRPGLERLRDLVATGTVDRVYVHAPDRLARRYAYQVLLLDEFRRGGAEVVFLNRPIGVSPEDDLLLQVQGMVAEYERAQILDRTRGAKLPTARPAAVSVLSTAPYGYRYTDKRHGGGVARYEVVEDEAAVVRLMFGWLGHDRVSIGEVCRRLRQAGRRTRAGVAWQRGTVWRLLKNPAYAGRAAFGKTRAGPLRPRLRPIRGSCGQPRRGAAGYAVDPAEWVGIPVPAVVDPALFAAVQEQLAENRRRSRQRAGGERYLLQGLVVCRRCGYGCHGRSGGRHSATGEPRGYAYYRCSGSDRHRFGGQRMCDNTQVRADLLEAAVWGEVERLLRDPGRIAAEHERRLRRGGDGGLEARNLAAAEAQLQRLRRGIGRLIDGYAEGLIERAEFEPRVAGLRQRLASLEEQRRGLVERTRLGSQLALIIGRLEAFAARVGRNLDQLDRRQKRGLVRLLVRRVEIDRDEVNVVFRVEPPPLPPEPADPSREQLVQHCHRHADADPLHQPGQDDRP
jgi:site-specific DNA recombinase